MSRRTDPPELDDEAEGFAARTLSGAGLERARIEARGRDVLRILLNVMHAEHLTTTEVQDALDVLTHMERP